MANLFTEYPMVLDTDFTDYYTAASIPTGFGIAGGLRIYTMKLVVGASAAAAGTVLVQRINGNNVLAPMIVSAGAAANSVLYSEDFTAPIPIDDFKVSGLTATGTKLYIYAH